MPEPWWSTDYATRRATCQVPKALTLQTTPQLAVEMLRLLDGEDTGAGPGDEDTVITVKPFASAAQNYFPIDNTFAKQETR
jgi:hypothetical protein